MRILLTNDDGVRAEGILLLEQIAQNLADGPHDIWVVAPLDDMSGSSHSLTTSRPLRVTALDDRHFGISGSPTDCVALAIGELMYDGGPDLLLSGINNGWNMGNDILYSGTVGAAMEGVLHGIPSFALSHAGNHDGPDHKPLPSPAGALAAPLIESLLKASYNDNPPFFNINFPAASKEAVAGVAVTDQSQKSHLGAHNHTLARVERGLDPRGNGYYWIGFNTYAPRHDSHSDVAAVRDKYISVTPLSCDLTNRQARAEALRAVSSFKL